MINGDLDISEWKTGCFKAASDEIRFSGSFSSIARSKSIAGYSTVRADVDIVPAEVEIDDSFHILEHDLLVAGAVEGDGAGQTG